MESKLPPLSETDPEGLALGNSSKVELSPFPKCQHELYLVSSTEAKCRKCPVGYQGPGILKLVQASQTSC